MGKEVLEAAGGVRGPHLASWRGQHPLFPASTWVGVEGGGGRGPRRPRAPGRAPPPLPLTEAPWGQGLEPLQELSRWLPLPGWQPCFLSFLWWSCCAHLSYGGLVALRGPHGPVA